MVVKYMEYHVDKPAKDIEKPLRSANMSEVVGDQWDAEFVDVEQETLFELILVCHFTTSIHPSGFFLFSFNVEYALGNAFICLKKTEDCEK